MSSRKYKNGLRKFFGRKKPTLDLPSKLAPYATPSVPSISSKEHEKLIVRPPWKRYRTKDGSLCDFDSSDESCSKFGFVSGQLIVTQYGRAKVIGVYQNKLWFHLEGDNGCSFWNDFEGGFEPTKSALLPYKTNAGRLIFLDTAETACGKFGFLSGQRVQVGDTPATVIGIAEQKLWIHLDAHKGATHCSDHTAYWNWVRDGKIYWLGYSVRINHEAITGSCITRRTKVWFAEEICKMPQDIITMTADDNGNIFYMTKHGTLVCIRNGVSYLIYQPVKEATSTCMLYHEGKIYVSQRKQQNIVWRYDLRGRSKILVGSSESMHRDGSFFRARFNSPIGLKMDHKGNLYITEWHYIRKLNLRKRTVKTIAGSSSGEKGGYCNGEARTAQFYWPSGIVICEDDTIYVCDQKNHCIRQIKNGHVSTLTGSPKRQGHEDGPFETARFSFPCDLVMCPDGTMLVSNDNHSIRRINLKERVVTTLSLFNLEDSLIASNKKGEVFIGISDKNIFKLHDAWKVERLLWIGHLKEDASYCVFARLPKELIREIIYIREGFSDVIHEGFFNPIK